MAQNKLEPDRHKSDKHIDGDRAITFSNTRHFNGVLYSLQDDYMIMFAMLYGYSWLLLFHTLFMSAMILCVDTLMQKAKSSGVVVASLST